jgi:phosphate transport system ATP-binding protein
MMVLLPQVRAGSGPLDPSPFLRHWGLPADCLERPWLKLSGGERQRVLLAISLATRPRVLLLDEPTSSLDDETKEKVESNIRELECAVLLVTHDKMQAERLATSMWKMSESGVEP